MSQAWGGGDANASSSERWKGGHSWQKETCRSLCVGGDMLGVTELKWGGNEVAEGGEREV